MAKRRPLSAPSVDDLKKLEDEVRRETSRRPVAPIAQVAGDAALAGEVQSPEIRAEIARNKAAADRLETAEKGGLLMSEIALSDIDADAMIRDRTVLDEDEMLELRLSIAKNGLRMPIEVFELSEPSNGRSYGLLSGYRRLMACRGLVELGREEFRAVKCIVRAPDSVDQAYVAMVEENEIRSALSHFERGRIAVISTGQGAFANVEDAVAKLFESASKAKRSKIRSFALVFEDLGDLLSFPEALTEKRGLAVANALRAGAEKEFRTAFERKQPVSAGEEWTLLESVISTKEEMPRNVQRGGRPKVLKEGVIETSSGFTIRHETDSQGIVIRVGGRMVDGDMADILVDRLRHLLEAPE